MTIEESGSAEGEWKPDNGSVDSFQSFYASLETSNSLSSTSARTVRIFNRGDYYTVHGSDAVWVADNVFRTSTVIKYFGKLASVSLSQVAAESLMRQLLTDKLFLVELYENSSGASRGGGGANWKCTRRGSPGNIQQFEEMLFHSAEMTVSPLIAALNVVRSTGDRVVGVAFVDTSDRVMGISEFHDTDLYSNFESLLIQMGVRECLVPSDLDAFELDKVRQVLVRCDVVVSERKFVDCGDCSSSVLPTLLANDQSISVVAQEMSAAMGALSWLLDHLDLMGDNSSFGHYSFRVHSNSKFMRLDAAAVKAVHLVPQSTDGSSRSVSLFGLLDKCLTAQGSRLLFQFLRQPLMDYDELVMRQDLVSVLFEESACRQDIMNVHLKGFPDLSKLARRFQKSKVGLREVVRFYDAVVKLPELCKCLSDVDSMTFGDQFATPMCGLRDDLQKFRELVESTIDLDAVQHHEYRIKSEYNPELGELKVDLDTFLKQISAEAQTVADDLSLEMDKKLKVDKNSQFGYFFRVSRLDSAVLRNKKGYTELSIQKSGVYFTSIGLRALSSECFKVSEEYEKKQSVLVQEIIEVVRSYCPLMAILSDLVSKLDVFCALAHVAYSAPVAYVKPKLFRLGEGNLILKESRHPCLEVQEGVSFIANDISMKRNESEFVLITGPNMGGKSTYIRQVATISLLAQIGSFVPCAYAEIPIFDCILARVGAGDSQLKGVSTFMAEMQETSNIIKTASKDSLVIIDELGRGTSTYDGFGLAWAISEFLASQVKCFGLFATHFHELTALADSIPTIKNVHVAAVVGSNGITLLYKVQDGASDQSFGIHVAELAKFPAEVISMAKKKVMELQQENVVYDYDHGNVERVMKQLSSMESEDEVMAFLGTLAGQ
eukprot:Partr_v1_DN28219_c0_g1_i2_m76157 putative DNA mismatch repair protein Msh2